MTKLMRSMTLGALALCLAVPTMSFAADSAADTFKGKCAMCTPTRLFGILLSLAVFVALGAGVPFDMCVKQ